MRILQPNYEEKVLERAVLKLPFSRWCPFQRAVLGGALEWRGTLWVPPQLGCPRVCPPWAHRSYATAQWRNFPRGCPWARDGWVPHWLRSACAKCKKSKRATRANLSAWGPGARLRAPVGSRGKAPGGDPGNSCAFQCRNSISHANLYTYDCYVKDIVANNVFTQVSYTQHAMPIIDGGS